VALNLGELVAGLRADEGEFLDSLSNAELAMRNLTRDVDGRLRDLNGRFVTESEAMGSSLAYRIGNGARAAAKALRTVGVAAAGLGVGVPAAAALATALGGVVAGAAAAGLAVKAFQLAAKPQLESVAEASKAAETAEAAHEKATLKKAQAQKLAAKGGDEYKAALREAEAASKAAKEADAAYEQQLKGLPPATREYAMALHGLKKDHQEWSDQLSKDTMPVFTKGITIARDLLPTLTPFVQQAAAAFGGFLDEVSAGVKSAGFKEWAADMSAAAGPALRDFLTVIKNLAVGFGGLLQAFLPVSDDMTGGLVEMTEAFANWGASLKDSEGFAQFLALAREGGGVLATFGQAALQLVVALSPVIGVTAQVAMWLAQLINMVPPDVLAGIGTAFAVIALGLKTYSAAMSLAATATRIWAAAQLIFNAIMTANPVGIVIVAIVALVAAIVIAYKKSETFRRIVQAVWTAVKSHITFAVAAIKAVLNWFGSLPARMSAWWNAAKNAAVRQALALVSWVRGLPGRIVRGLGAMNNLLVSKGRDVIRGLWNGIKSMGSWLKGQLISFAKNAIPGPIAKALGISSPSRVMAKQVGRWIPAGIVQGIESGQGAVDRTMAGLVSTPTPGQVAMSAAGSVSGRSGTGSGSGRTVLEIRSNGTAVSDTLLELLRDAIQVRGGNVQTVIGR
jgi:hypothetical protein